ncbi:MAG: hypothetical protein JRI92_00890 [Deltaproteobacteria bacterium]|nr:hypothetical protein [Deltaproteobacteria bacterium]
MHSMQFQNGVAVHGLKLESRNSGKIKKNYVLDVYKPTEALPRMAWHHFDRWNKSMVTVYGCRLYSLRLKKTKSIIEL